MTTYIRMFKDQYINSGKVRKPILRKLRKSSLRNAQHKNRSNNIEKEIIKNSMGNIQKRKSTNLMMPQDGLFVAEITASAVLQHSAVEAKNL